MHRGGGCGFVQIFLLLASPLVLEMSFKSSTRDIKLTVAGECKFTEVFDGTKRRREGTHILGCY